MHVNSFPLGPLGTNSYILDNGIEALAIDVGGDPADMLAFLSRNNLKLLAILITHSEAAQGGIWGMPMVPAFSETSLSEGSTRIGSFEITVLNTPGHTPGSVSYYIREAGCVFTGDALFYRSVGRTDFPMGDHQKLLASIRENLFTLPPETIVYPGHGPQSSIGDERQHNPFVGDFA